MTSLPGVCSWTELTFRPLSELLLLACHSIFSPSTHTTSFTQMLMYFSFLTLSAAFFSHVCCRPFLVLFPSLIPLHMPQVHMYTSPPSCKIFHVMPRLRLMWPLQLWDLAASARLSLTLRCFCFDLSTSNDIFFHLFSQVSSEFSAEQLSLHWPPSCFNKEQQNNCHLLLSKWLCALPLHGLLLHTQFARGGGKGESLGGKSTENKWGGVLY